MDVIENGRESPRRRPAVWIVGVVVALIVAALGYNHLHQGKAPAPAAAPVEPDVPLLVNGTEVSVEVPRLQEDVTWPQMLNRAACDK